MCLNSSYILSANGYYLSKLFQANDTISVENERVKYFSLPAVRPVSLVIDSVYEPNN